MNAGTRVVTGGRRRHLYGGQFYKPRRREHPLTRPRRAPAAPAARTARTTKVTPGPETAPRLAASRLAAPASPEPLHSPRIRAVAQFGSALALGARGRGFESRQPDAPPRPARRALPGPARGHRAGPGCPGPPSGPLTTCGACRRPDARRGDGPRAAGFPVRPGRPGSRCGSRRLTVRAVMLAHPPPARTAGGPPSPAARVPQRTQYRAGNKRPVR